MLAHLEVPTKTCFIELSIKRRNRLTQFILDRSNVIQSKALDSSTLSPFRMDYAYSMVAPCHAMPSHGSTCHAIFWHSVPCHILACHGVSWIFHVMPCQDFFGKWILKKCQNIFRNPVPNFWHAFNEWEHGCKIFSGIRSRNFNMPSTSGHMGAKYFQEFGPNF